MAGVEAQKPARPLDAAALPAAEPIAGVYVHVPYCLAKCGYCAFNSRPLPDAATLERYQQAVSAEFARGENLLAGGGVRTVYFGGGTPSLADPAWIGGLIADIAAHSAPLEEITVEANPAALDADRLAGLRGAGVDRLSIGVQSFDPAALAFMECSYRVEHVEGIFAAARRAGFANVGLDLIVGLPEPYAETWRGDLERALALAPEHLSVYLLTVEAPSRLFERVRVGAVKPLPPDRQADIFLACHDRLAAAGYEHYEVSNYARPGRRSQHNSRYWQGAYYWGLGAGAHSYLRQAGRPVRRANLAHPERYMRAVAAADPAGAIDFVERLTPSTVAREKIMLELRTAEGLAPADFGDLAEDLLIALSRHAREGRYVWDGRRYRPTPAGLLVADGVAVELWDALG
jgi:oxygen-independent coproporphyrinogen-3 oxidase